MQLTIQVASYLRSSTGQYLVISHKEQFYSQASAVIGIYSMVSRTMLSLYIIVGPVTLNNASEYQANGLAEY